MESKFVKFAKISLLIVVLAVAVWLILLTKLDCVSKGIIVTILLVPSIIYIGYKLVNKEVEEVEVEDDIEITEEPYGKRGDINYP